jgi:hypothetical protein
LRQAIRVFLPVLFILGISLGGHATSVITGDLFGKQDMRLFDLMRTGSFTYSSRTGSALTLSKVGTDTDSLAVYGDGGRFTDSTISAALSAIGSNKTTLCLAPGTWTISNNLTMPANINLKPEFGAILSIATGKTLTVNGGFQCGPWQCFILNGAGEVEFGAGALKEVLPEWWGITGIGDQVAINAALRAHSNVRLSGNKTYSINGTINIDKNNAAMVGDGPSTIIDQGSYNTNPAIRIGYVSNIEISHLSIKGNKNSAEHAYGILTVAGGKSNSYNLNLHNLWFSNTNSCAIIIGGVIGCNIDNIFIDNTPNHGIYVSISTNVRISNTSVTNCGAAPNGVGFKIKHSTNVQLINCYSDKNYQHAYSIETELGHTGSHFCKNITLSNCLGFGYGQESGLYIGYNARNVVINGGYYYSEGNGCGVIITGNADEYPIRVLLNGLVAESPSGVGAKVYYGDDITFQGGKYIGSTGGYNLGSSNTAFAVKAMGVEIVNGYGLKFNGRSGRCVGCLHSNSAAAGHSFVGNATTDFYVSNCMNDRGEVFNYRLISPKMSSKALPE